MKLWFGVDYWEHNHISYFQKYYYAHVHMHFLIVFAQAHVRRKNYSIMDVWVVVLRV
jgi:hypothetical protein